MTADHAEVHDDARRSMNHKPNRTPPRPRRGLIAIAALVAVGGGIALALLLHDGGQPPPSGPSRAPVSQSTAPKVSFPKRNPPQSPPWGFTGLGWQDVCY